MKKIFVFFFFYKVPIKSLTYQIDIPFGVLMQLWTYIYNVVVYKKEYRFTAIVGQRITFVKHYNAPYGATKWLLHNKDTNVFHIYICYTDNQSTDRTEAHVLEICIWYCVVYAQYQKIFHNVITYWTIKSHLLNTIRTFYHYNNQIVIKCHLDINYKSLLMCL